MSTPATVPLRHERPPTPARERVPVVWWLVVILASLVALYAFAYVALGDRMYPPNLKTSFVARPWGIYTHALFGGVAMLLGPFQLNRRFLRRNRARHRALGLAYIASATLVGAAGLYMSAYSYGGWVTHLGFGMLAVLLLATTWRAYAAARGRDFVTHREWMLRSYSLIFGAVTLRIWLPILIASFGDFDPAYAIVAWISWVPNIMWAEWYVRRSRVREAPRVRELATA